MAHELIQTDWMSSTADEPNIDSAGAEVYFTNVFPWRPKRIVIKVTTAVNPDNTVALDINIYKNPVAGSETNRVLLGTMRVMAANAANLAAGTLVYRDFHFDDTDGETAEDGTTRNLAPDSYYDPVSASVAGWSKRKADILIGESLQLELAANAEADSGAVTTHIEYERLPWVPAFYGASTTVVKDVTSDVSTNPST